MTINDYLVCRAILVLATAMPGTLRAIQLVLELLFGRHCALGFISEKLQACGEAAERYNATLQVPEAVLAEADEIFLVALSAPENATIGTGFATGTIIDVNGASYLRT